MRFNVAEQLKQPIGQVRQYQINEINSDGFPVRGQARLLRTNRGILVAANLKTAVKSVCSRCLEKFECPLTLDMEEEYFPSRDMVSGLPLEVPEEAGGFTIDEDHVLDLDEAIRQHTQLMLPMKPICREDCAGLCPICGQNLNQGPCSCSRESFPSTWAPLRRLFSGDEERGK